MLLNADIIRAIIKRSIGGIEIVYKEGAQPKNGLITTSRFLYKSEKDRDKAFKKISACLCKN